MSPGERKEREREEKEHAHFFTTHINVKINERVCHKRRKEKLSTAQVMLFLHYEVNKGRLFCSILWQEEAMNWQNRRHVSDVKPGGGVALISSRSHNVQRSADRTPPGVLQAGVFLLLLLFYDRCCEVAAF